MDHRRHGAGSIHDIARLGAVLRRARAVSQRAQRVYALLCHRLPNEPALVRVRIFHRIWQRNIGILGRRRQTVPERRDR